MADWTAYIAAAKTTLDLFKGIWGMLPQGPNKDDIQKKIEEAERQLKLSEAELAKGLGFRLCRCTFPPQIMLWQEGERASVCPQCGNRFPPKPKIEPLSMPGPLRRR